MPAKSESQQSAAGIALAVKRGELPKNKLRGASRQMYESMSMKELKEYAGTSHKGIPHKKGSQMPQKDKSKKKKKKETAATINKNAQKQMRKITWVGKKKKKD